MQRYQVQRAPIRVAHIRNVVLGESPGLASATGPRLPVIPAIFRSRRLPDLRSTGEDR